MDQKSFGECKGRAWVYAELTLRVQGFFRVGNARHLDRTSGFGGGKGSNRSVGPT